MIRGEYERRRQKLDEELRAGIELLEMAHRAQVRALDLVWSAWSEEAVAPPSGGPPVAVPVPRQAAPVPRRIADLRQDLPGILDRLPEIFDRRDVCRALAYEPPRGALYKALGELVQDGVLALEESGFGQVPSRYRKR